MQIRFWDRTSGSRTPTNMVFPSKRWLKNHSRVASSGISPATCLPPNQKAQGTPLVDHFLKGYSRKTAKIWWLFWPAILVYRKKIDLLEPHLYSFVLKSITVYVSILYHWQGRTGPLSWDVEGISRTWTPSYPPVNLICEFLQWLFLMIFPNSKQCCFPTMEVSQKVPCK